MNYNTKISKKKTSNSNKTSVITFLIIYICQLFSPLVMANVNNENIISIPVFSELNIDSSRSRINIPNANESKLKKNPSRIYKKAGIQEISDQSAESKPSFIDSA